MILQKKLSITLFLSIIYFGASAQTMTTAANTFLAALTESQKSKALYPLDDPERFNWHFVPKTRNGLNFKSMTEPQRTAAIALLKTSMSEQGVAKANEIMANEDILRALEQRPVGDTHRDPLNYFVTIFGNPSKDKPWFWRLEGHHLALNFSCTKNTLASSTPSFWGSNPGTVLSGELRGKQILKQETELALQLVNSFTDSQKKMGILSATAPSEIVSGNSRKAQLLSPAGLPYDSMNFDQKQLLLNLLDVYIYNYELGFGTLLRKKITDAGFDKISFAWAGGLKALEGNYYRIQGPMLLIEYDNTQNNGNHVHSVVRDLTNDFAEDVLRDHYLKEHN